MRFLSIVFTMKMFASWQWHTFEMSHCLLEKKKKLSLRSVLDSSSMVSHDTLGICNTFKMVFAQHCMHCAWLMQQRYSPLHVTLSQWHGELEGSWFFKNKREHSCWISCTAAIHQLNAGTVRECVLCFPIKCQNKVMSHAR